MYKSKTVRGVAHLVSTIFQPLLMPLYGVILLFAYTHFKFIYATHYLRLTLPVFLFSFLIPGLLIFLMLRMGIIRDISLKRKNDRFLPYIVTLLSYTFLTFYFYRLGLPTWFIMLIIAPMIVMILAIVITVWWKISAHMFGVGGLVGGVLSVCNYVEHANPYPLFMALFFIAGLIGTSRLILRRHTIYQVVAGFFLGFIISYICVYIGA